MRAWSTLRARACVFVLAALCSVGPMRALAQYADAVAPAGDEWDRILLLEPVSKSSQRSKSPRYVRHRGKRGGANKPINPRTWHAESPGDFGLHAGHAFPPLVVHVVGQPDPFVIPSQSDQGGFDEAAQAVARDAFGGWDGGPSLHPRLLALIYRATRHFNAPSIHLISGLRNDRKASRHSHGMAADIVLPGVRDEKLAAHFREQGFTGVGTYPRSGFVHIDVREASYFWVDRSPPNKRYRVSQVRGDESKAADAQALARGEQPTANPEILQHALEVRATKKRPKKQRGLSARASKAPRTRGSSEPEVLPAENPVPASNVAAPASDLVAPGSDLAAPGSKVAAPGSEAAAPGSNVAAPAKKAAPVKKGTRAKKGAPASNMPVPESAVAAPGSTIAAPGSIVAAPASNVAAPASNVAVPAGKVAPGSRVGAPASNVVSPASNVAPPSDSGKAPSKRASRHVPK